MNKNIKITLFTSIAVNILLICFVLGSVFGMIKPIRIGHARMDMFAKKEESLVKVLPEDKQAEAKEILSQLREIRFKNFQESKPFLEEAEALTTAEKFDEAKFLKTFDKYDSSISLSRRESNVIIAKFLSKLSAEDRVKLVEEFKKGGYRFPKFQSDKKRKSDEKLEEKSEEKSDDKPELKSKN